MNIAEYLVKRLEELGVADFFGVSGDYNYNILSAIEKNQNAKWINCVSALNAGYAADGYARIKGYGVIISSYGDAELTAINAVAGAYAENVPVVHIVGVPSTKTIVDRKRVCHNFFDVQPYSYAEAYKSVTATTAFLNRDNAKMEIDRVLKVLVKEKKPVYIAIPQDIAKKEVNDKKVDYNWESDKDVLLKTVDKILERINRAKKPLVLGDILIKRFEAQEEYKIFVEKTGFPVTNFLMGTNIIEPEFENNLGTYFSKYANSSAQKYMEETDCLISVGAIYSDINSFGMTLPFKINSHIAIYGTYTYVEGIRYENIKMSDVLKLLSEKIEKRSFDVEKTPYFYEKPVSSIGKLSSKYIYPRLQEFLKEDYIFIAETGSVINGVSKINYPNGVDFITQSLWTSKGWATPVTLGVSMAQTEKKVVLLTGDSSHQISASEVGNMLKNGLKPVIIVLNNKAKALQRACYRDSEQIFDDLSAVNFSKLARVFEGDIWSVRVETEDDFDKALKVTQIMNKLCYIEVCVDSEDLPTITKDIIKDFKKSKKEESANISELYTSVKVESKVLKEKSSFGTKVHESLKG